MSVKTVGQILLRKEVPLSFRTVEQELYKLDRYTNITLDCRTSDTRVRTDIPLWAVGQMLFKLGQAYQYHFRL